MRQPVVCAQRSERRSRVVGSDRIGRVLHNPSLARSRPLGLDSRQALLEKVAVLMASLFPSFGRGAGSGGHRRQGIKNSTTAENFFLKIEREHTRGTPSSPPNPQPTSRTTRQLRNAGTNARTNPP